MRKFPPGFTVAVVSPAGPTASETFDAGVSALRAAGAAVKVMPHARGKWEQCGYLAASDIDRASDLTAAWLDPEVSLILCARGGYGCARILPLLDWELLRRRQIPVAGFSDVTALHFAMTVHHAGKILASPMLRYFGTGLDPLSEASFFAALADEPLTLELPALRGIEAQGALLPANLTVAASLAGTAYFPSGKGKLLLLEDVGEAPYRIDRMLTQLRLAGLFDGCAGVIFGNFTDCGETAEVEAVLRDFAEKAECPVFCGFPFGHQLPLHSVSGGSFCRVRGKEFSANDLTMGR